MLLLGFDSVQAQSNLYFRGSSGELTTIPVSSVKNLTFSNGHINVNKQDGNTSIFGYSSLRYFSFSDLATGIEPSIIEGSNSIVVYPNPVTDVLILRSDIQLKSVKAEFFDLLGNAVVSGLYGSEGLFTRIDLSQLTAGLYVCRITADGQVKTVKIIKN